MATYQDIQEDVKQRSGRSVKTCWIAHVKELNGLPLRRAPNRESPTRRVHPCPEWAQSLIEKSMRHFGLL